MSSGARTPDEIYEEIKAVEAASCARDNDDGPEYWMASAEDYDRIRDLWRELVSAIEVGTGPTPTWAINAALLAGRHAEQAAHQYRRFARDVERVSIKET